VTLRNARPNLFENDGRRLEELPMPKWGKHRISDPNRFSRWTKFIGGTVLTLSMLLLEVSGAAAATPGQVLAQETNPAVWPLLLALLFGAVAVERAIELGWNYIEWLLIRFLRWRPGDLKTPSYFQFKSGTSLLAGLFLGILVANYSGMRLLEYLTPYVPTFLGNIPDNWDIILSGIVIGAGTKPAHDLLGIITHLKNFTASSALKQREQAGAALAEGILKLRQTGGSGYSVEVPGLGATRVGAGARSRLGEDGDDTASQEARLARYAEIIHDNLYLGS
jgi:hypothetical protein